jgi:hypothetical protein
MFTGFFIFQYGQKIHTGSCLCNDWVTHGLDTPPLMPQDSHWRLGNHMALVLRPEARHWVAAIKVNGKLRRFPLTHLVDGDEVPIPIQGRRPSSIANPETGDRVFQSNYHAAMAAHDRLVQQIKARHTEVELTEKLIKARTGKELKTTKISDLPSK